MMSQLQCATGIRPAAALGLGGNPLSLVAVSDSPGNGLGLVATDACLRLIDMLTRVDLADLAKFASFRLAKVGLIRLAGEDVVQDALLAVVRGAGAHSKGRHPRPVDVANSANFIDYLKGVIGSLVEAERRSRKHQCVHEPFEEGFMAGEHFAMQARPAGSPLAELEFCDLRQQLFHRLEERVPHHLRGLVLVWREQWDFCDRIPLLGRHRRCRAELRQLAAQVLKELTEPGNSIKRRNHTNEPTR
jgi:hypothetical protein